MIHLTCECGEVYHADESQVGRAIRCGHCGRVLRIEAPVAPPRSPGPTTEAKPRYNSPAPVKRASGLLWFAVTVLVSILFAAIFPTRQVPELPLTPTTQPSGPLPSDVSLATGTELWPFEGEGSCELVVENGTDFDGLVKLVNLAPERTERIVFVQRGDTVTIQSITPGTYILRFALGYNLVGPPWTFARHSHCGEFERQPVFVETEQTYSTFKATLHEVSGGTARTDDISEAEFVGTDEAQMQER